MWQKCNFFFLFSSSILFPRAVPSSMLIWILHSPARQSPEVRILPWLRGLEVGRWVQVTMLYWCALCSVQCAVSSVQWAVCIYPAYLVSVTWLILMVLDILSWWLLCSCLSSVQCAVCSVQCAVFSVYCSVLWLAGNSEIFGSDMSWIAPFASASVCRVLCAVCSVQCAVCSVHCSVFSVHLKLIYLSRYLVQIMVWAWRW